MRVLDIEDVGLWCSEASHRQTAGGASTQVSRVFEMRDDIFQVCKACPEDPAE